MMNRKQSESAIRDILKGFLSRQDRWRQEPFGFGSGAGRFFLFVLPRIPFLAQVFETVFRVFRQYSRQTVMKTEPQGDIPFHAQGDIVSREVNLLAPVVPLEIS